MNEGNKLVNKCILNRSYIAVPGRPNPPDTISTAKASKKLGKDTSPAATFFSFQIEQY